jgi:ubiquinone/menaquinone biosynthesis C-methylase UbiE
MIGESMTTLYDKKDDLFEGAWDDKQTEDYVGQWGELPLHQKIPEFCHLLPSETVLDIGCGSGATVRAIASILTTGHVTGIDPTSRMVEIATDITAKDADYQRMTFLQAGAERIPVESGSCDLVVAVNTLHHWVDIDAGLDEVLRVLKSSGRFVAIDDLWEEAIEYAQEYTGDEQGSSSEHALKTRGGIVTLLDSKGFSNISDCEHREPDATASIITGYKI